MDVDEEIDGDDIIVHPDDPVPWFPEQSSADKPLRLKRRRRCGECGPCQIKTNCGECAFCVRRSVLKQSCVYRKCIYLRKPLNKRSPSSEDRPVKKRRKLSTLNTSKSYSPTLLIPDADGHYPYDLLSPSEQEAYLDEFLSPPSDSNHRPDFSSPPDEREFSTEVRVAQHGGIIFPEFVACRCITINDAKENDDDSTEQIVPIVPQEVTNVSEVKVMPDPSESARVICTPPHPQDHDDEGSEVVNPQMLKALKTLKECGHNFIQTKRSISDDPSTQSVDNKKTGSSSTPDPAGKPTRSRDEAQNLATNIKSCELKEKETIAFAKKLMESITNCSSPNGPAYSHPIHSLSSSYGGRNPFVSPPNVTVGRSGGFTQSHGAGKKSSLWPDRCGSSLPLNLSQNQAHSPHHPPPPPPPLPPPPLPPQVPSNPADFSKYPPWTFGLPPYGISPMTRMPFPPGAFPHPYPIPGLEYPSFSSHQPHPAFSNFHNPYFPPRMPGINPFPAAGSLFPPERYPYPTGMYSGSLFPHMRPPHPHLMYHGANLSHQAEDYSLASSRIKPPLEKEDPESGEKEEDKYRKFSIFRLQGKTSVRDNEKKEIKESTKREKPEGKRPTCNNDTLRSLLNKTTSVNIRNMEEKCNTNPLDAKNSNNNSLDAKNSNNNSLDAKNSNNNSLDAKNSNDSLAESEHDSMQKIHIDLSKAMQRSDIDEDLRKEMHKVSGYCGCNFITIDDLRMQALIRSDGVNNLEIEIPSPDAALKDPIPFSIDKMLKSKTPPVAKETQSTPQQRVKPRPAEVPVKGMVSLKQDLGEEGVLILEVNSDKVQLVQCELSEDILKYFKDPNQVKEFVMNSQSSEKTNDSVCMEKVIERKLVQGVFEYKIDSSNDQQCEIRVENDSCLLKPPALKKGVYHLPAASGYEENSKENSQSIISKLSSFVKSKMLKKDCRKRKSIVLDYTERINRKDCGIGSVDTIDQPPLSDNRTDTSCMRSLVTRGSYADDRDVAVNLERKHNDSLCRREITESISPLNLISSRDASDVSVVDLTGVVNVEDIQDKNVIDLNSSGADSIKIDSIEEDDKKEDEMNWRDSNSVDNSAKIIIEDHQVESGDESYRIEINDDFDLDLEDKTASRTISIDG